MLIIWHTVAIVFMGPWHRGGMIYDGLYPFYQHYLVQLGLGSGWRFYVNATNYEMMRYQLSTQNPEENFERPLSEAIEWGTAVTYRYIDNYEQLTYYPELAASFADYLCQTHKDAAPQSVTLRRYTQVSITREMYLKGARPFADDFTEISYEQTFRCLTQDIQVTLR